METLPFSASDNVECLIGEEWIGMVRLQVGASGLCNVRGKYKSICMR